jgi:hypothetical protein
MAIKFKKVFARMIFDLDIYWIDDQIKILCVFGKLVPKTDAYN